MDEQGFPVGDTTDWPGIIVTIILIAVVAQLVIGYLLWRYSAEQERRRAAKVRAEVAGKIFDKIDRQLQAALRATGGSTQSQLQLLIDVIAATTGKTMAVGGGLGKQVEGMRKALSTKIKEPPKPDHGHTGAGTALIVRRPGQAPGLSLVSQSAPTTASASAAAGAASVSVTTTPGPITTLPYPTTGDMVVDGGGQVIEATSPSQVYFIGHGHEPHHGHKPPEPVERELTSEEVRVAARRAIEGFAEFWTRESVERLLKEAQIELTTAPVADSKEELVFKPALAVRAPAARPARAVKTSAPAFRPLSGPDLSADMAKPAETPAT